MTMALPAARLAAQSVHVTTDPIPRSLADGKLVLAALQKFGEVVTFRNLKYDTTNTSPSHARSTVAIFETPTAAARAIQASEITIPLTQKLNQAPTSPQAQPATDPDHSNPASSIFDYSREPFPRYLRCRIQPSHHNHASAITRNPYHTIYTVDRATPQYKDLVRTQIPLTELADSFRRRKERVPFFVRRRVQRENEVWGAGCLWGLFEEGGGGFGLRGFID